MAAGLDRNLTSHTYNEATAISVEKNIRTAYYPLLVRLKARFAPLAAG